MELSKMSEIKEMADKINRQMKEQNLTELFRARYVESDEVEILILEDFESHYFETIVIYEDKAHFFGDSYPSNITKEELIKNLNETWGENYE